jgi:hypothetical protein
MSALRALRQGPWKFDLIDGKLYNLATDIGESTDVADKNPDVVRRLRELAEKVRADLGDKTPGPGCRPPGRVANARPILDTAGNVRPELVGTKAKFE